MTGLRERSKMKAMRSIQEHALDLFDERGFNAVTIEEIAAAAEVSPSSIYRYFGTKEGIVVADEFDRASPDALSEFIDANDPIGSLLRAIRTYESTPDGSTADAPHDEPRENEARRRVRYFFTEPSVRQAVCAVLDRAGQRITPLLAEANGLPPVQARVLTNSLVFGYFAALEQWFLDDTQRPIADYVDEGLAPLRRIWPAKT
ncbi:MULTISPECIES: TetR/AcrR family transcriptional regulator [Microbacterium]|uniref:TetR/AcrR family transcriptional regulator n=1 Tax=Microbacterium TaxID=33882 RepID=UPI000D64C313|nr:MULTISPECIES: TetR/AcrR family transcriptional regulator [Microbacterium]